MKPFLVVRKATGEILIAREIKGGSPVITWFFIYDRKTGKFETKLVKSIFWIEYQRYLK